ncbi:MAG: LysM peptidoglycan-binding domain-containing protein [Elusimicrobiota bacterium]
MRKPAPIFCLVSCLFSASLAAAAGDTRHTVVTGDTMWDLADRYYGDHLKWRRIAEANPAPEVNDPHWIYPGQTLLIPGIEEPKVPEPAPPAAAEPVREPTPPVPAPPEPVQPAPAPPRAEKKAPAPEPVRYSPHRSDEGITVPDSLSERLPGHMAGQQPAVFRMMMPSGWKEDGRVREMGGKESLAAQGDLVEVAIESGEVRRGKRYSVYRISGPTEADADKSALYVQKVGLIELTRKAAEGVYRAAILRSGDSLQPGDLIKAED